MTSITWKPSKSSIQKERENVCFKTLDHLPGVQGPNHASLLSNNILKHELSSHPEASLLFQPNVEKHNQSSYFQTIQFLPFTIWMI